MDIPIGVFDSGVGGLTVLRSLLEVFPHENFLYLGDTARLPYGTKSSHTIRKYSEQALHFLIQRKVKALVIACNSSSSQMHEDLFDGVPLITVIRPGAKTALATSLNGRIGILATPATIASRIYEEELLKLAEQEGKSVSVFAGTAPLFVPLAEEGWVDDPITNLVAYRYLSSFGPQQIDTLILGCTHYPILRNSIAKALGGAVQLVESGPAVAAQLQDKFERGEIVARKSKEPRSLHLVTTDESPSFKKVASVLLGSHQIDSLSVVSIED
jgi:glutamate racemase